MFAFRTAAILVLWSFILSVTAGATAQDDQSLWGRTLMRIEISGLRHTKRDVVIRELASKEGEPYLAVNAERDTERLDRLGVFNSVKFRAIGEGEGVVLQLDVKETFPYLPLLSIEITEENGTAVGPGFRSVNFLGRAINMSASTRFGGQTVVELRAETPLFLGSTMAYEGAFVYRDRFNEIYEFQEESTDFEVGFGRRWGETGRFGAIFNFLSVESDTLGATLSLGNKDEIPSLGAFVNYDSRDRISNTHEGWHNQFLASKSGILGGDGDFWTYTIDVRRYQLIVPRHTVAFFSLTSLRTGTVGEDIPVYLQFNLGGTNTIRGWSLGARGGKNQSINTLEYRYELMAPRTGSIFGFSGFLGLQLTAFGDLGSAWNDGDQFLPSFIGGYGVGIRAIVPFVNMVRFDVGWGEAGMGLKVAIGVMEKAEMQRRRVR